MIGQLRPFLAVAVVLLASLASSAQEPIRFPRTPDISPDGKQVAFSYLGDIWVVETIGGIARPVTMHEAHDINPCFSPDGRWIAFSSNRHGSYDAFVVAAYGGKPRRLTWDSAPDMVTGWTPDGKHVVFSSSRSTAFPMNIEAYTVPVEGGPERKLPLFEGKEAYFSPDGKQIAYTRGPGLWYRRGYRGSSNDDLWVSTLDGAKQQRLTSFEGQDSYPMWSADGRKLYYVSEHFGPKGCANIVCQSLTAGPLSSAEGPVRAVTTHRDDTVRRARISGNGEWIVYECGADIWVAGVAGDAPPRKLAIEVHADDKSNTERNVTYTKDATEFALSPDEKHAVVGIHGELFLTRVPDGGKAVRLTETPAYDHSATFSPDGKSILFISDRSGVEDLYLLQPDDAEHPELTKAHKFKLRRLTDTPEQESAATFSPGRGDKIAFIRKGQLWTMKPDGSEQKPLVAEKQVFDYDWSPDGKHIVFARSDGSFASELYIVPSDGSAKPRNITRYATFNGDVTWSKTGNRIGFIGLRQGTYLVHVLALQRPAAGGGSSGSDIDWDDIHLRTARPSSAAADTAAISPDGTQVAYKSGTGGGDLWVVSASGRSLNRLTTGGMAPKSIHWSQKSTGLIYFLSGTGEVRSVRAGGGFSFSSSLSRSSLGLDDPGKVPFQATMTIRQDEEYQEMFAQCWRKLSDFFYDPAHHGADWKAVREKYRPLVDHVAQREDLYALISLMLGELNASHLGISGRMPTPDETTADLGLIFDDAYKGPGLKIAEVLKRGPADKRGLLLLPDDIIVAIDRVPLTETTNVSKMLNNKAGEVVLLDVTDNPKDAKSRRRVEVTAIERSRASKLMYERWVEANAEAVAKKSEGRLGYIHIPSMDSEGLESFVRALYSDNFDKEGIVLDVRYNGGGFTHDQVLSYLTGKEHTVFRQRDGGGDGLVLRSYDRKWARPLTLMMNNRSYSDAEIFPHAFRALGLGKLVGQATGGHVIGTSSTRLIDGSQFRIPRTGVWTNKGENMERVGVAPDVRVEETVEDWHKGIDTQIAKAVEVLKADVVAWKKARAAVAGGSLATGPAPAEKPIEKPLASTSGSAPVRTAVPPKSTSSGGGRPLPPTPGPIPQAGKPASFIPPAVD